MPGTIAPKFRVGDRVAVRRLNKTGHIRIPYYVRGREGVVEQYCGMFLNPEELARGNTAGPAIQLYRVLFAQGDLWLSYDGPVRDTLCIEIYEHWLARPGRARPGRKAAASGKTESRAGARAHRPAKTARRGRRK